MKNPFKLPPKITRVGQPSSVLENIDGIRAGQQQLTERLSGYKDVTEPLKARVEQFKTEAEIGPYLDHLHEYKQTQDLLDSVTKAPHAEQETAKSGAATKLRAQGVEFAGSVPAFIAYANTRLSLLSTKYKLQERDIELAGSVEVTEELKKQAAGYYRDTQALVENKETLIEAEAYHNKKANSSSAKLAEQLEKQQFMEKAQKSAVEDYVKKHARSWLGTEWTFDKLEKEVLGQQDERKTLEKRNIYNEYLEKLKAAKINLTPQQQQFQAQYKPIPKGLGDTLRARDDTKASSPSDTPGTGHGISVIKK